MCHAEWSKMGHMLHGVVNSTFNDIDLRISTVFRHYNRHLGRLKEIAVKATGNTRIVQK